MPPPIQREPDFAKRQVSDDPFLEFEPERPGLHKTALPVAGSATPTIAPPVGSSAARPKVRLRVPINPGLIAALFILLLAGAGALAVPGVATKAWSGIRTGASSLLSAAASSSLFSRFSRAEAPTSADPVGPPSVEAIGPPPAPATPGATKTPAEPTADPAAPRAPAASARTPISRPGTVTFRSPLDLDVYHQGRLVGSTAAGGITLPAGAATVTLVSEAHELRLVQSVNVASGAPASVAVRLPNGRLSVNALPWAQVWADGQLLGTTPLANVPLRVGSHEIVWRHPTLGERRQTIVIKAKTPARVGVDLSR